jgi:hypothetical protein
MSYEPKAVEQLQIIVTAGNEYYHATFREADCVTLQEHLDAFTHALNVAGFTYVRGLTMIANEELENI